MSYLVEITRRGAIRRYRVDNAALVKMIMEIAGDAETDFDILDVA